MNAATSSDAVGAAARTAHAEPATLPALSLPAAPVVSDTVPWPAEWAQRYRERGYWTGQHLSSLLWDTAQRHGEHLALVAGDTRWCYRELAEQAERLARGFLADGLRAGERVVVQLPNCAEYLAVVFALWRIGAVPVFALPAHRFSEISAFCLQSDAAAYVSTDVQNGFDHRELARQLLLRCPALRQVYVAARAPGAAQEFGDLATLGQGPAAALALPPVGGAHELAFLQLSGGSTGTPKLIPRTHDEYAYSVRESARICGLDARTVYLCVLPSAHNFAMSSPGLLGVMHAGGTLVLAANASPELAFALIERERVSFTALVPPLVPLWLEAAHAPGQRERLRSLQVLQVGGARFDDVLAEQVQPTLGAQLQQVFGMAEGLVNYTRLDDAPEIVCRTQGRPISPDDEIRVLDDDDQPVAPGEVGHLLTRGPYTIRGYWRAPAHNARAFTPDGFYRTGDRVRLCPNGYLQVEGRAKDQINRGGEKIAAEEIEHLLMTHPDVVDAALVAMPDAVLGEKSCAFVIPRDPMLRKPQLMQHLRALEIAAFKLPDRIELVPSLPKTPVGKVDKKALRQRVAELLGAARGASADPGTPRP